MVFKFFLPDKKVFLVLVFPVSWLTAIDWLTEWDWLIDRYVCMCMYMWLWYVEWALVQKKKLCVTLYVYFYKFPENCNDQIYKKTDCLIDWLIVYREKKVLIPKSVHQANCVNCRFLSTKCERSLFTNIPRNCFWVVNTVNLLAPFLFNKQFVFIYAYLPGFPAHFAVEHTNTIH